MYPMIKILPSPTNQSFFFYAGATKGVQQKNKVEPTTTTNVINDRIKLKKDEKPVLFEKPIDELVNFIEGNKAINEKRAAKKARRREKKVPIFRTFIINNN